MPDTITAKQIKIMFEPLQSLQKRSADDVLRKPGRLSEFLKEIIDKAKKSSTKSVKIDPEKYSWFATASVEMWHRAIHSFIISASLTIASSLWSSVAAYYSSHYAIRAFAHLFGYFHSQSKGKIVHAEKVERQYVCNILPQGTEHREHGFYWKTVKRHTDFCDDPFFNENTDNRIKSGEISDGGHRNIANYWDHINNFPEFQILNEEYLRCRIDRLSKIELSDTPVLRAESYPAIENVQLLAYRRFICYRKYLDEILGTKNKFWKNQRSPEWCRNLLNFQGIQAEYLATYKGKV